MKISFKNAFIKGLKGYRDNWVKFLKVGFLTNLPLLFYSVAVFVSMYYFGENELGVLGILLLFVLPFTTMFFSIKLNAAGLKYINGSISDIAVSLKESYKDIKGKTFTLIMYLFAASVVALIPWLITSLPSTLVSLIDFAPTLDIIRRIIATLVITVCGVISLYIFSVQTIARNMLVVDKKKTDWLISSFKLLKHNTIKCLLVTLSRILVLGILCLPLMLMTFEGVYISETLIIMLFILCYCVSALLLPLVESINLSFYKSLKDANPKVDINPEISIDVTGGVKTSEDENVVKLSRNERYKLLNKRVGAWYIDFSIMLILQYIFLIIMVKTGNSSNSTTLVNYSGYIIIILLMFKDIFTGRSFGKFIWGLTIVDKANGPLSKIRLFIRNITAFLVPLEGLMMYYSPKGRVGDMWARTSVVEDEKVEYKQTRAIIVVVVVFIVVAGLNFLYRFIR